MPAATPPVPAQVRIPADQRARFEALCAARYAALPSAERAALSPRDHAIAVVVAALADGLDIAEDRARRVAVLAEQEDEH